MYVWSVLALAEKKRKHTRLWFQCAWAALTNGYAAGFAKGTIFKGPTKAFCVPGLNCYSCPGALGSCPIGALQAVLGDGGHKLGFYVLGFLMVVGALFGRFVCGWLCPFGLIQDLLYKIPFFRKRKNLPGDRWLKWMKYVILGLFVILLPLVVVDFVGQGQPWFCKLICPAGTLMAGLPLLAANESLRAAAGHLFVWKAMILALIVVLSLWVYRPFCKYLCPLGAVYGLFNPIAFYRLRVDPDRCIHCGACQRACGMEIPVFDRPNSAECIRCGDCMRACPTQAITSTVTREKGRTAPRACGKKGAL